MTTLRRILISTSLAVAAAGVASANSISYYYPSSASSLAPLTATSCNAGSPCVSSIPNSQGDFAFFTLSPFTVPTGYQLDSVTFSLSGVASSTLAIDNQNNGTITASGTYALVFDTLAPTATNPNGVGGPTSPYQPVNFVTGGLLSVTPVTFSVAAEIQPDSPYSSPPPNPGACSSTPPADSVCNQYTNSSYGMATSTTTVSSPGSLSILEDGTAYVPLFVASANGLSIYSSVGSNETITTTSDFAASLEVTYNYSAISTTPEPGTMALLGGALIGLGLIGKKRLKKS